MGRRFKPIALDAMTPLVLADLTRGAGRHNVAQAGVAMPMPETARSRGTPPSQAASAGGLVLRSR
ncbi:MAG: hypothetical protein ACREE9_18185 [Stellaceae bacterium]